VDSKRQILEQWGNLIVRNAHSGALTGKPLFISQVIAISGPRAGALELHAGVESGRLLRVLAADSCAILRQFIPFDFVGEPACYMSGRYVRVEAGWPDSLAEKDIKLSDLGQHPKDGGRWIAGKNELGQTVTLGLNNSSPHWLIAGTTGAGKSYAMRSAVSQLCRDPGNRLVLIDGKFGEGLKPLAHIANLVGPLAKDVDTARQALSWAVGEMRRRYESPNGQGRLVVVCDEVQEIAQDALCAELLRRLVTQGRAARVHCILGTQHPVKAMFGDDPTIKRNLPGRLALKVLDAKSSEVAVGAAQPRADYLLGAGDAYAIVPGKVHRAQLAYIPERELGDLPHGEPLLSEWPDYDPGAAGTLPEVKWAYEGGELAVSIIQAHLGNGRRKLVEALKEAGFDACEGDRVKRLSKLGRDACDWLKSNGWTLLEQRVGRLAIEHTPEDAWETFFEQVSV